MKLAEEKKRLEKCAADGVFSEGVNTTTNLYAMKIFARHWRGDSILELGCGDGNSTAIIAEKFKDITVVEGSAKLARKVAKLPVPKGVKRKVICSLFEEWKTSRKFDTILLNHTLEHVEDPVRILKLAKRWLKPGGVICAAVPNSNSLHRQAAVLMGLLPAKNALTPTDIRAGHRRVSGWLDFQDMFWHAKLNILKSGGYWLKPVSNAQVDRDWTRPMVDAFMKLGEQYPDIAAELYVIAEKWT